LHAQISEYVLRSDYEALQRENEELRERLNEALEKINELTNSD
jgi:cell division septum initiation protein DivIVA